MPDFVSLSGISNIEFAIHKNTPPASRQSPFHPPILFISFIFYNFGGVLLKDVNGVVI
jgi:hypothetical protein